MRQSAVKELECSVCGQVRWSVEGSVCTLTLGCTGKMKKEGNSDKTPETKPKLDGCTGQTSWTQPELYSEAG